MAAKLYPPYIEGTIPAFCMKYDGAHKQKVGADITIPFSMNSTVSDATIVGFSLRLRTASTGSYLFAPIFSTNYSTAEGKVIFSLTAEQANMLNEGQYYKVQIAYCGSQIVDSLGNTSPDSIGYYSTVGIIKCTSLPTIRINNLNSESTNFFTNDYLGIYDQSDCVDQTEKVYSYEFIVYDHTGEQVYTTNEQLHRSYYDTEYNFSVDKVTINNFIPENKTYSIQYRVTTTNGLELTTPRYKITNQNLMSPNDDIKIIPQPNNDDGYINVTFKGTNNENKSYYFALENDLIPNKEKVYKYVKVEETESFDINQNYYIKNENNNYILQENLTSLDPDIVYYRKKLDHYITDTGGYTLPYILSIVLSNNTEEKITYLKRHSVYKAIKSSSVFYYRVLLDSELQEFNNYYYYKDKLLDYDLENLSEDDLNNIARLEKFELLGNCRELIKTFPYSSFKENELQDDYYIILKEPYEKFYYGSYLLSRADDSDNYTTWVNIAKFRLDEQRPSSYSIKDFTIEHGKKYKYALQQYNIWGLYSSFIYSDIVQAAFEDMYLYDGEKTLKIRYNPEVNTFKTTILEAKSDTLGGRFPYITRNGETYYKEFPVGGLLAQELDVDDSFSYIYYGEAHRHSTYAKQAKYDEDGNLIEEADIPENALRDPHMFSDQNIALERQFKLNVLDWLNNGKPKLFKSPYEGNYIVRLMQVSLTPVKELGRMLHSFTSTAYEIAECTYENLVNFGFIKASTPSDYVGLWKTYNFMDDSLLDGANNIEIHFDQNLMLFTVQDMMPGDIIRLKFHGDSDWTDIMIGITGSYTYAGSDRALVAVQIPNQHGDRRTGVLNCYYKGIRVTSFDSIIGMQLKTIVNQQFIGVSPWLVEFKNNKYKEFLPNADTVVPVYLAQSDYEDIQNYNIRDKLSHCAETKISNGQVSYRVTNPQEFIKFVNTFDPSNIIDRINVTLDNEKVYKIELLNIEQARFRLRDIIPVYAYETREIYKGLSDSMIKEEVKYGVQKKDQSYNDFLVSTSPYGYPHPIEELSRFDMIDPYAIYQVWYRPQDSERWTSKNIVQVIDDNSGIVNPDANSDTGYRGFNAKIPFDIDTIYYIKGENEEFAPLPVKTKTNEFFEKVFDESCRDIFIDAFNNNILYYESNEYVYYDPYYHTWLKEQYNPTFSINNSSPISLATIKEKFYKDSDLQNINIINIGNGVIAELTFQIKVIDYYTEVRDQETKKAKDDYLAEKELFLSLLKSYSVIANADYCRNKYGALSKAYDLLLNSSGNILDLSSNEEENERLKKCLFALLNNTKELQSLNLLKLYEIISLDKNLDVDIVNALLDYKNKHKTQENFGLLNDLMILLQDNSIFHFIQQSDIKFVKTNKDNNNKIIGYSIIETPDEEFLNNMKIYYQINSVKDTFYFAFIPEEENNDGTVPYYELKDNQPNIVYHIFGYDNKASYLLEEQKNYEYKISKLELLTDDELKKLQTTDNFFIAAIELSPEAEDMGLSFFEKESLENLLKEVPNSIEGINYKIATIENEIQNFENIYQELEQKNIDETNQYIEFYQSLQTALTNYNNTVYSVWAALFMYDLLDGEHHIIRINNDTGNSTEPTLNKEYLQLLLSGTENIIGDKLDELEQNKLDYYEIGEQLYKDVIYNRLANILVYNSIINDQSNDNDLDEYLSSKIESSKGELAFLLLILKYYNTKIENDKNLDTQINAISDSFSNDINIINEYLILHTQNLINNYQAIKNNLDQQINLVGKGKLGALDLEKLANISIYYDDIKFIEKEGQLPISIPDSIVDPFEQYKEEFNQFTLSHVNLFNRLKSIYIYAYRKVLQLNNIVITDENVTLVNTISTFILNPLSTSIIDESIENDEITTNADYFNSLSQEQQKQVLIIHNNIVNTILDIIKNDFPLNQPIFSNDVAELLLSLRNSQINPTFGYTSLINDDNPKEGVYNILQEALSNYNLLLTQLGCFDITDDMDEAERQIRKPIEMPINKESKQYLLLPVKINNYNFPYSLEINGLENQITKINEDNSLKEEGLFYDYLSSQVLEEIEQYKIILEQAQRLYYLYTTQRNNYLVKLTTYKEKYNEYIDLYDSFLGTDALEYYLNKDKEVTGNINDSYLLRVKRAWWKFLSILDSAYTKEKEGGLYI